VQANTTEGQAELGTDAGDQTNANDAAGNADGARPADAFFSDLYANLRDLASHYMRGDVQTLQPTALVHEAYLKCAKGAYRSREHFQAVAASAMRQVLVDHARGKRTLKRGGDQGRTLFDVGELGAIPVDVVALDDAMTALRQLDSRKAAVVELRVFGGLTIAEVAAHLGVSLVTVSTDWRFARAWLGTELAGGEPNAVG
jgi:RNA polymerase sigma factor (TIGR02999 family)